MGDRVPLLGVDEAREEDRVPDEEDGRVVANLRNGVNWLFLANRAIKAHFKGGTSLGLGSKAWA